jgi:hypothetical protein
VKVVRGGAANDGRAANDGGAKNEGEVMAREALTR